jgi:ribosomal-protein-alanine N-acetyltransferase
VEAACVPDNLASAGILLGAGFHEEGFAQSYLRINGNWRDHRLFAIVQEREVSDTSA